jgi:hypothetical protein
MIEIGSIQKGKYGYQHEGRKRNGHDESQGIGKIIFLSEKIGEEKVNIEITYGGMNGYQKGRIDQDFGTGFTGFKEIGIKAKVYDPQKYVVKIGFCKPIIEFVVNECLL